MWLPSLHLLFAVLLFSSLFADLFFLRTGLSNAIQPVALIRRWRFRNAIFQMLLFVVIVSLGLTMWIPLRQAYPAKIFHSKIGLAVLFLLVAKIRVLRERKSQKPGIVLTRILAAILFCLFCLGIVASMHLV